MMSKVDIILVLGKLLKETVNYHIKKIKHLHIFKYLTHINILISQQSWRLLLCSI